MDNSVVPSDLADLTARLARGDDLAWSRFHQEFGPVLFRFLLGAACGDHDLAGDALQQSYLRVARHVRRCDSLPMFNSWLRAVGRSALCDCRRRRRTWWDRIARHDTDAESNESAPDHDTRVSAALAQALSELPPEDRRLLEDKYFDGRAVQTIAASLAVSPKAVESRLTRARVQLRHKLTLLLRRDA